MFFHPFLGSQFFQSFAFFFILLFNPAVHHLIHNLLLCFKILQIHFDWERKNLWGKQIWGGTLLDFPFGSFQLFWGPETKFLKIFFSKQKNSGHEIIFRTLSQAPKKVDRRKMRNRESTPSPGAPAFRSSGLSNPSFHFQISHFAPINFFGSLRQSSENYFFKTKKLWE